MDTSAVLDTPHDSMDRCSGVRHAVASTFSPNWLTRTQAFLITTDPIVRSNRTVVDLNNGRYFVSYILTASGFAPTPRLLAKTRGY